MRLQPVGRDRQGLLYWLQLDHEQNIRLYTEEQDDSDGSTWKCIVRQCFCLILVNISSLRLLGLLDLGLCFPPRSHVNVQNCLVSSTVNSLFRSRNDLAEALELLKAQVNPSVTQDQEQSQVGLGGTSPTQKDTGMWMIHVEKTTGLNKQDELQILFSLLYLFFAGKAMKLW